MTERTGIVYILFVVYLFMPFEFCAINMNYLNVFIKNLKLRKNFKTLKIKANSLNHFQQSQVL